MILTCQALEKVLVNYLFIVFISDILHLQDKRKRIAELSFGTIPVEVRTRSQWDFVLEEMAWLANDFAQVWFS